MPVISAVAAVTEHLGLVVTSSTVFEEPYANARRFATLDHLTKGRIGWNVVTSASAASAAALFGRELVPHDARYDMADDYLDLTYHLLQACWDDDAVVADRTDNVYAVPERVHQLNHQGPHYRSRGVFSVPPSPQRVPLLFQAGSSGRGRQFAARHAECVFLQGTTVAAVRSSVSDIRDQAVGWGRHPHDVKILVGLTIILGRSDDDAAHRYRQFLACSTDETAAAQFAFNTGIDLLSLDMNQPLPKASSEQGRSNVERYQRTDGTAPPTVREILDEFTQRGLRGLVLVGTPQSVADQIEDYVDTTGVDGFLIESYLNPTSYDDLIDRLLPVLQERGLAPSPRTGGTLRERILPDGSAHLSPRHPGRRCVRETAARVAL